MLLDALVLGEPVPESVVAAARQSRVGAMLHVSTTESQGGSEAYWTFAVRDDRLVSLELFVGGDFAALVAL